MSRKKEELPPIDDAIMERRRSRARLALTGLLEVPPISWYSSYVQRTLPGGHSDIDTFVRAAQLQRWTLLFGPTGSGKTLVSLAVAAKLERRWASINLHGGVSADNLIGRWVPCDGSGMPTIEELRKKFNDDSDLVNAYIHKYRINYKWIDGRLTDFFRNGGILDLAEMNMAPPAVTSFLFQMFDDRCQIVLDDKDGEVVHAHPDFWCISNFNEGYAGTEELNDALVDRFPIKLFWDYDAGVEKAIIDNKTVLEIGKRLRSSNEVRRDIGTRSLKEFCENIKLFGESLASEMFACSFDPSERKAVREAVKMEFSKEAQLKVQAAEVTKLVNDPAWKDGIGKTADGSPGIPVFGTATIAAPPPSDTPPF